MPPVRKLLIQLSMLLWFAFLGVVVSNAQGVTVTPSEGPVGQVFTVNGLSDADCGQGMGVITYNITGNSPGTFGVSCTDSSGNIIPQAQAYYTVTGPPPVNATPGEVIPLPNPPPIATATPPPPPPIVAPCEVATRNTNSVNLRNGASKNSTVVGTLVYTMVANASGQVRNAEGLWYRLDIQIDGQYVWVAGNHVSEGAITRIGTPCPLPLDPSFGITLPNCANPDLNRAIANLPLSILEAYSAIDLSDSELCQIYRDIVNSGGVPAASSIAADLPRSIYTDCPELLPELTTLLYRIRRIDTAIYFAIRESYNDSTICTFARILVQQEGLPYEVPGFPTQYANEIAPLACIRSITDERYETIQNLMREQAISDIEFLNSDTCRLVRSLNLLGSALPPLQDRLLERLGETPCQVLTIVERLELVVKAVATRVDIERYLLDTRLCTSLSPGTLMNQYVNTLVVNIPLNLQQCEQRYAQAVALFMANRFDEDTVRRLNALLLQLGANAQCRAFLDNVRYGIPIGTAPSAATPAPIPMGSVSVPPVPPSGTTLVNNVMGMGTGDSPTPSPNVPFVSAHIPAQGIMIVRDPVTNMRTILVLRGGKRIPLDPNLTGNIASAVLSPDGHHAIYYTLNDAGEVAGITRVTIQGYNGDPATQPEQMILWSADNLSERWHIHPDSALAWSPTRDEVYITIDLLNDDGSVRETNIYTIPYILDIENIEDVLDLNQIETQVSPVVQNGWSPSVSPDGLFIAFSRIDINLLEAYIQQLGKDQPDLITPDDRRADLDITLGDCQMPFFATRYVIYMQCEGAPTNNVIRYSMAPNGLLELVELVCASDTAFLGPLDDAYVTIVNGQTCYVASNEVVAQQERPTVDLFGGLNDAWADWTIEYFAWSRNVTQFP